MNKFDSNMSRLFRSVGADDSGAKASTSAVAQEAEQRWPLLKAVPPAKPEATPPLHPRARQHMGPPGRPAANGRKQALTLPSLGDKLKDSLNKMAAKPVSSRSSMSAPEPEQTAMAPLATFTQSFQHSSKTSPQPVREAARSLFSAMGDAPARNEEADFPVAKPGLFGKREEPEQQESRGGMFGKRAEKIAPPAEPAASKPLSTSKSSLVPPQESRGGMFARRAEEKAPQETRKGLFGQRSDEPEVPETKTGLFGKRQAEPARANEAVAPAKSDKSLASVFARIEDREEAPRKDSGKDSDGRSSFLGRLGKR